MKWHNAHSECAWSAQCARSARFSDSSSNTGCRRSGERAKWILVSHFKYSTCLAARERPGYSVPRRGCWRTGIFQVMPPWCTSSCTSLAYTAPPLLQSLYRDQVDAACFLRPCSAAGLGQRRAHKPQHFTDLSCLWTLPWEREWSSFSFCLLWEARPIWGVRELTVCAPPWFLQTTWHLSSGRTVIRKSPSTLPEHSSGLWVPAIPTLQPRWSQIALKWFKWKEGRGRGMLVCVLFKGWKTTNTVVVMPWTNFGISLKLSRQK